MGTAVTTSVYLPSLPPPLPSPWVAELQRGGADLKHVSKEDNYASLRTAELGHTEAAAVLERFGAGLDF